MTPIKISELPQFFGDSSGSYVVINDSSNSVTYIVKKEDFLSGSFYGTASYALTASYAMNGGASGFPFSGSAVITGSLLLSESFVDFLSASYFLGNLTGSLEGTSSWALYSVTASYTEFAQTASYVDQAQTASFVNLSQTASYVENSQTSSFLTASNVFGPYGSNSVESASYSATSSYAIETLSASYASTSSWSINSLTASSADDFTVRGNLTGSDALFTGTITAQTLYVQYITASTELVTGSTQFGTQLTDTHQFTGSVSVTGSLSVDGPLNATSSWAQNAITASYVELAQSSSFVTASEVFGPFGSNSVISASQAVTASYAVSSSYSITASYALDGIFTGSNAITRTGSAFEWGGVLNKATSIDGASAGAIDPLGFYTASFDNVYTKGPIVEDPVTKKIYVGGYFESASGAPVGKSIIRLNPDFSVDTSFNPGVGIGGNQILVRKIIVDKSISKIYVGGIFYTYSGSTVNNIVRLNEDGTIDSTFKTNGGLAGGGSPVSSQGLWDMKLDSSGKLYVVGNFTSYSGSVLGTDNHIIKINQDGTKDTSFDNSTGFSAASTGLSLDSSGNLYVVGIFTSYKGTAANRIISLKSDGSINNAFNYGDGLSPSVGSADIATTKDNKLIVLGNSFTSYSGSSANRIVKINLDGTIDTTFNYGTGLSARGYIQGIDNKNRLYIGLFTSAVVTYNGTTITPLTRLLSNGNIDTTFNRRGSGFSGTGATPVAFFLDGVYTTGSNDYALVGGKFLIYNNVSSSGLIRMRTDDYYVNLTGSLLNYDLDYSYLYTDRTLVDRGYVDGKFTGSFFTGSVILTGSLRVNGSITGSLFGTSSWSTNAVTASFITTAQTASFVATSSWANNAITSSYVTASNVFGPFGSNSIVSSSYALTASYVLSAVSSSFASTASFVTLSQTASFVATASWAQNAVTASYVTASNVFGPFGSNSVISSSYALTASFALNAGGAAASPTNQIATGSVTASVNIGTSSFQLTSASVQLLSVSSSGLITGRRMFLSASQNTISGSTLTVYGSGSAQPVFTVQGSQGELFSVTDSLSGSLFSVNDISGLPIIEAFSDNRVLIGSYQAPALITTVRTTSTIGNNVIYQNLPTASYDGAFFDYTLRSGSNARAGQITAMWSGSSVNFTETTTTDFGDTSGVRFGVIITGSNMALTGSFPSASWTVKTIVRSI